MSFWSYEGQYSFLFSFNYFIYFSGIFNGTIKLIHIKYWILITRECYFCYNLVKSHIVYCHSDISSKKKKVY